MEPARRNVEQRNAAVESGVKARERLNAAFSRDRELLERAYALAAGAAPGINRETFDAMWRTDGGIQAPELLPFLAKAQEERKQEDLRDFHRAQSRKQTLTRTHAPARREPTVVAQRTPSLPL